MYKFRHSSMEAWMKETEELTLKISPNKIYSLVYT